jgi:hypothetical protein
MVLAVLATVGGFLGFPHEFSETIGIHLPNVLESWLGTILPGTEYSTENGQSEIASAFVATLIALMGMGLGFMLFSKKFDLPFGKDTLLGKFYVDEFYGKFLVTPFLKCAGLGSIIIENTVQRLTYSIVVVTQRIGFFLKDTQTGDLQHSVVTLVLAVMTFAIALVFA